LNLRDNVAMRRRLIISVLVCLLLGAAINIAVAWGCALWLGPLGGGDPGRFITPGEPPWLYVRIWNRPGASTAQAWPIGDGRRMYEGYLSCWQSGEITGAVRNLLLHPMPLLLRECFGDAADANSQPNRALLLDARGWPCVCLSRTWNADFRRALDDIASTSPAAEPGAPMFTLLTRSTQPSLRLLNEAGLPLRPMWRGILINTACFAAALFIAAVLARWTARRLMRSSMLMCSGLLAICLLCGVFTTVAVAWTSAAWRSVGLGEPAAEQFSFMHDPDSAGYSASDFSIKAWSHATSLRLEAELGMRAYGGRFARDELDDYIHPALAAWLTSGSLHGSLPIESGRTAEAHGWPLLAMWCGRKTASSTAAGDLSWGIELKDLGWNPLGSSPTIGRGSRMLQFGNAPLQPQALPLGVLGIGFVVNSLMAAALWATVLVASFTWFASIRGLVRARRGRCRRCGYDVAHVDHSRCPECGATVVRRNARSA
jgi:hypothetical protein